MKITTTQAILLGLGGIVLFSSFTTKKGNTSTGNYVPLTQAAVDYLTLLHTNKQKYQNGQLDFKGYYDMLVSAYAQIKPNIDEFIQIWKATFPKDMSVPNDASQQVSPTDFNLSAFPAEIQQYWA